jgi:fatty acyl-CoA reductase
MNITVVPAWKEPFPGWVDSLNGPMGLLVAAGKGVLRSMHCNRDYHAEVIPVDVAINGLIAAAWRRTCDQ